MRTTNQPTAIFQWRVYLKGEGFQYYAFYPMPREPFAGQTYRLIKRDRTTDQAEVGLYTMAQYEARVAAIIERADCEIFA